MGVRRGANGPGREGVSATPSRESVAHPTEGVGGVAADDSHLKKKKLQATLERGMKKRVMESWWQLVEDARFNAVVEANHMQQRAQDRYIKRLRDRAVMVYQRRKLAPFFYAWRKEAAVRGGAMDDDST